MVNEITKSASPLSSVYLPSKIEFFKLSRIICTQWYILLELAITIFTQAIQSKILKNPKTWYNYIYLSISFTFSFLGFLNTSTRTVFSKMPISSCHSCAQTVSTSLCAFRKNPEFWAGINISLQCGSLQRHVPLLTLCEPVVKSIGPLNKACALLPLHLCPYWVLHLKSFQQLFLPISVLLFSKNWAHISYSI